MKKTLLLLLLTTSSVLAFAQLKVASNGNVYIKRDLVNDRAKLNIGTWYGSNIVVDNDINMGIHIQNHDSIYRYYNIGLLSEANKAIHYGSAIGVWGQGTGSAGYKDIGVLGTLHTSGNGAAVMGTTEGAPAPPFTGSYAGYFYGHVWVDCSLTAYEIYNLSDMRLNNNVTSLREASSRNGRTLDWLLNLDVLEYNTKRPGQETEPAASTARTDEDRSDRRHYGLSARELQTIYPDLVTEGQSGYLAINYTELVPLLLRSIQELKAELDEVRGDKSEVAMSRSVPTTISTASSTGNVLYQNTPNPFKEQTTIRFSLADDARDASICIFDMTGKMLKKLSVSSGDSSVSINGWELGEGMFLYTLLVNGCEIDTKRMIITK